MSLFQSPKSKGGSVSKKSRDDMGNNRVGFVSRT